MTKQEVITEARMHMSPWVGTRDDVAEILENYALKYIEATD